MSEAERLNNLVAAVKRRELDWEQAIGVAFQHGKDSGVVEGSTRSTITNEQFLSGVKGKLVEAAIAAERAYCVRMAALEEAAELLRCAKANLDTVAEKLQPLQSFSVWKVAMCQVEWALMELEGKDHTEAMKAMVPKGVLDG